MATAPAMVHTCFVLGILIALLLTAEATNFIQMNDSPNLHPNITTGATRLLTVAVPGNEPVSSGSRTFKRSLAFDEVPLKSVKVILPDNVRGDEISIDAGTSLRVECVGPSKVLWWAVDAVDPSPACDVVRDANEAASALSDGGQLRELLLRNASALHAGLYCCVDSTAPRTNASHHHLRSCFYLYVKDSKGPLFLMRAPDNVQEIRSARGKSILLSCRPTSKDVTIVLSRMMSAVGSSSFDPRRGFDIVVSKIGIDYWICSAKSSTGQTERKKIKVRVFEPTNRINPPMLEGPYLVREGANVTLICHTVIDQSMDVTFNFSSTNPALHDSLSMEKQISAPSPREQKTVSREALLFWVTVKQSGVVRCQVCDQTPTCNTTERQLEVLRARTPHTPPRLLLKLLPRTPTRILASERYLKVNRDAADVHWFLMVAWEGDDVPHIDLMDPDGELISLNVFGKKASGRATIVGEMDLPKPPPGIGYQSTLTIKVPTKLAVPGNYTVRARLRVGPQQMKEVLRLELDVEGRPLARLLNGTTLAVAPGDEARLACVARSTPRPISIWWTWTNCKPDAQHCSPDKGVPVPHEVKQELSGPGALRSSLLLKDVPGDRFISCWANNTWGVDRAAGVVLVTRAASGAAAKGPSSSLVGGVVGVLALIVGAAAACVYFMLRQKRARRRLHCAGALQGLVEGAPDALDPTLPADEQAELLPYVPRWEFPREDLVLGRQLGAGAFGVVTRAEARGIMDDEDVTTVAVKMLKRGADEAYLRALASELKILVHLGRHLNVVNLLGACTGRIAERELLVIVEYCPFGNLHNYLLRHRDGFVDQVDPHSGDVDASIGAAQLAAAELSSRRARLLLGNGESNASLQCSPYGSDSTTVVTYCPTGAGTSEGSCYDSGGASVPLSPLLSDESAATSGGPQPLWRTNYRCDTRGPARILCTADLISWTYQVSCGMQYLAYRKILHGDLAARNVLLARDGIVKICDFGLARSMFKSDTYKKKGDGPLPIKWMAIESIRDRIFSTQSDVWSFGVVTWELFSLGATPYPGMQPSEEFYNKLISGYRMERPPYAPAGIYKLMQTCWEADPRCRPDFAALSSDLAALLDNSTRERIQKLNSYEQQRGGTGGDCDYLAMLGSPDYRALTSPDEHLYVNSLPPTASPAPPVSPVSPVLTSTDPDPEPKSDYLNMSRPSTPGSNKLTFY